MSIEQKALKACQRYAELSHLIREAKKGIGEHLDKCPGVMGTLQRDYFLFVGAEGPSEDDRTHLREFFTDYVDYAMRRAAAQDLKDCPHCQAAYDLVQARKRYRQQLGAAKRFILKIGKEGVV